MSVISALGYALSLRERHQHTRLENQDEIDEEIGVSESSGTALPTETSSEREGGVEIISVETPSDEDARVDERVEEDDSEINIDRLTPRLSRRATVSLAELEEERELARRRTSACILLAVFVLFRLWVEALQNTSYIVLLLCLIGTSWTAQWIRHNRDREEELDRRIAAYLDSSDPGTSEVERNDLRMLSFQAQLALAIMDSQRQMMQGGFGHPDGQQNNAVGLSEEAKERWERFNYSTGCMEEKAVTGSGGKILDEGKPQCSICLCEYEDKEPLVKLPCGHIYHNDCITSWTTNSTRCPLCNFDLESIVESSTSPAQQHDSSEV